MTDTTDQQAVTVAQDWVLVPREPTEAMVNACQDNLYSSNPSWNDPREIWSAMLATSPEPVPATNQAGEVALGRHDSDCGLLYDDGPEQCTCQPDPLREAAKAIIVKLEESEASFARNVANLPDEPPIGDDDGVCISVGDLRALRSALATQPATSQEGEGSKDTIAFVQEWMMSGDHEPDQWHRDFAAAIDARRPTEQSIFDAINEDCGTDAAAWIIARLAAAATPTPPPLPDDLREAAQAVIEQAFDFYKARNGRVMSIEGEDGEKCWIVPFDAFEQLRAALAQVKAS